MSQPSAPAIVAQSDQSDQSDQVRGADSAPLAVIGLGFAIGVGVYFLQSQPAPAAAIALLLLLAGIGLVSRRIAWALAALVIGFCWAHLWVCGLLCQPFPPALAKQDVVLTGRIASLPDANAARTRFLFDVNHLRHQGHPVDFRGRVRLSWYRGAPPLEAGEQWRLTARLKPRHGFVNPGGFDYERWLFRHQVQATGYVRSDEGNARLASRPGRYWLDRWRQALRERLQQGLPDGVGAALVPALVIGDRGKLTPAQWAVFSRTGTSHLIAISGLHVGLISGFIFLLVRRVWTWLPGLTLRVAAPRAGALAALAAALGYAALAGFAISTQRALVMLAVVLLAVIMSRTLRPWNALLLALAAVLLIDPAAVLDYGFWLSFGAVAALLYALGGRLGPPGLIARWGAAQWAVALGLLPMLIAFFGRASLIAPLVNLIAVPLFGLLLPIILLSALLLLVSGWTGPLAVVDWLLSQGYAGLTWAADRPWAAASLGSRPGWVWLLAALASLLLLAPRGIPGRWLGVPLLLPLWLVRPPTPPQGALEVTLLDVGQGLAGVLRTRQHCLVYDAGPRFPSGFNTGEAVVAPYLRHQGIDRVDILLISHADQDHAGGMQGLLRSVPARQVLSGEPDELEGAPIEPCRTGQRWHWDGVEFAILHPSGQVESGNDSSCVLQVTLGETSLLWPGDAEAAVEQQLVRKYGPDLQSELLIAAHHGSASSSTAPFLSAVSPSWVLFSMGWLNRFGFPAQTVRERVTELGARTLDTASSGAIAFQIDPDGRIGAPRRHRSVADRLWRHHPEPAKAAVARPAE
ncbi:DNA internalization-related competence protein ComEC/Rec2 [Halochromatium glycolicum]|uniref:DNA internalization-related competence protein ComEC/Rec2 n=1 Tax=Halochromatium glycolicum TaxID=85075 RepID=A0AAJ0XBH9_9GAMM|nr:DNA internalization-related competence protein ComEC/Rec2 [Halochromatium glycolicum]MBK1706413.1 DNA internalization-related competence protein ComEC/Rec2 [Halochromatium glycolicum]